MPPQARWAGRSPADAVKGEQEWTYRYLAAAHAWAETGQAVTDRMGVALAAKRTEVSLAATLTNPPPTGQPTAVPWTAPPTAQVRAWARAGGILVPERGRLNADIWQAWRLSQGQ